MKGRGGTLLLLTCGALVLTGCRAGPAAVEPTLMPSVAAQPQASGDKEGCIGRDQSVSHGPYTIENLAGASKLAVVGTVSAIEGGVWNTADRAAPAEVSRGEVSPDAAIFTPVNLTLDKVFSGDRAAGGSIRILNEGGTDGCSVMTVSGAPTFKPGSSYVVFLRDGSDADGKVRTDFDVVITAWPVDERGNVGTERDGSVPLDELAKRVSAAARAPEGSTPATALVGSAVPAPKLEADDDLRACNDAAWPPLQLVPVNDVEIAAPDGVSVSIANRSKEQLFYRVDGWIAEREGDCVRYAPRTIEFGPLPAGEVITSDVSRLSSTMQVPYTVLIWDRPCGETCNETPKGTLLIGP